MSADAHRVGCHLLTADHKRWWCMPSNACPGCTMKCTTDGKERRMEPKELVFEQFDIRCRRCMRTAFVVRHDNTGDCLAQEHAHAYCNGCKIDEEEHDPA